MGGGGCSRGSSLHSYSSTAPEKIIAPWAKVWLYFPMRSLHLIYLLDLTVPLSSKPNSSEFESARTETIVSAIESKVNGTWNGWEGGF